MAARFVVDNSVVMAWCFEDEANAYADAVLDRLNTEKALVPAIWPLEVGNVLLVAERKGRLAEADSARFLSLLAGLPLTVEQETPQRDMGEVLMLAREHRLTTYDASYLDLAMREGVPLATQDAELIRAARECRVPLVAAQ
ncbi:MAG: PIN domain-containing protein [Alphaproteobacteria bacterium]|nr:MAG: PIN domain-containing protein [Alphaproteobacteria bacterium]